ncbi:hypothetical protein GGS23DRAFT_61465 [Durotheca rogersii]|uniref:uncharacterized protein n=1 Tax=Durotheca rogersii TaxID=419775 RepID=UPI0022210AB8|nr:uncharacterized protein GGS23DRAFT_61465 [Durotheca rogersii]KAI5863259.1 hypothetical protein GGS23DRAFT_61465 [Durotheca rogersii]
MNEQAEYSPSLKWAEPFIETTAASRMVRSAGDSVRRKSPRAKELLLFVTAGCHHTIWVCLTCVYDGGRDARAILRTAPRSHHTTGNRGGGGRGVVTPRRLLYVLYSRLTPKKISLQAMRPQIFRFPSACVGVVGNVTPPGRRPRRVDRSRIGSSLVPLFSRKFAASLPFFFVCGCVKRRCGTPEMSAGMKRPLGRNNNDQSRNISGIIR